MNEMAVCGCSMKVDWNYKNKNLLKTGLLLLLYVVGIYLLITKMILLEKSGSGAGKPETGRTSDVSRGKENEKALQKAILDIRLANEALIKNTMAKNVAKIATYIAVPISIAELLTFGTSFSTLIGVVGSVAQLKTDLDSKQSDWLFVAR